MQGDLEFKAQFDGNVLVTAKITFDYEIIDPIKFIGEAKFLGKSSGTAAQAAENSNMNGIETAENQVIDKRIREVATSRTVKLNIVDFNPAKFEDELLAGSNEELAKRGVRLNSMTLVIIPEDQTRQAIDAATAMNVYASKGLKELGERLAVARAGAAKIVIDNTPNKQ
jgi:tRNA(Leu) C34 or U34 (ribose-2'-O)-methylase TrmL